MSANKENAPNQEQDVKNQASQNEEAKETDKSKDTEATKEKEATESKTTSWKTAQDWTNLNDKHNSEIKEKDEQIRQLQQKLEKTETKTEAKTEDNSSLSIEQLQEIIAKTVENKLSPLNKDISEIKLQKQKKEIEIKTTKLEELGFSASDFLAAKEENPHIQSIDDFIIDVTLNHSDKITKHLMNKNNPSSNAYAGTSGVNVDNNQNQETKLTKEEEVKIKQDVDATFKEMGLFAPKKSS